MRSIWGRSKSSNGGEQSGDGGTNLVRGERKKQTLDEFFEKHLSAFQRSVIRAACVDMWEPFRQSLEQWVPECRIIYDKFHILQHASQAVDEVRQAAFFREGGAARDPVRGKRWLLLTSWLNLDRGKRHQLNALFALNRRILKAYLWKESLSHLWDYSHEGAMLSYLQKWIDQLRWQRLKPMEKLASTLLAHLEGILTSQGLSPLISHRVLWLSWSDAVEAFMAVVFWVFDYTGDRHERFLRAPQE